MDEIKLFDRVILMMDHKIGNKIIKEGTIGTYRTNLDDSMLIHHGYNNGIINISAIPNTLLRKVLPEELDGLDAQNFLPKIYWPGNLWAVQTGYENYEPKFITGEISVIYLSINEEYDKIEIQLEDGSRKIYEKRFLENHGLYIPDELPKYDN